MGPAAPIWVLLVDVRQSGEQLPVSHCNPNRQIREALVGAAGRRMTKSKAIKTNGDRTLGGLNHDRPSDFLAHIAKGESS